MNICFVSREYPSDDHAGGIGTFTEKTARALAALGHAVTVITEAAGEASVRREDGVDVRRLPRARLGRLGSPRYARTLLRSWAVAHELRGLRVVPDVVQVCEFGAEAFWYSLGKHPGTKLVTRLATPTFVVLELSAQTNARSIRNRCLGWMERMQTYRSDAIISPTDALADIVCRRWGIPRARVTRVRTGVDFAERFASTAARLPDELEGQQYGLFFGRLEERKGLHILAEALPEVLRAHPTWRFVFAGNNFLTFRGQPMQAYIEQCNAEFRDRLHFFPRLVQTQLYPLLANAQFVVLPSLWEALANATLESLSMGKPVIATQGCGFGEVVEDGRSGLLVPPGDAQALREAMLFLLTNHDQLARMSEAAKARAQDFDLMRVTPQLLAVYERLCPRPLGAAA